MPKSTTCKKTISSNEAICLDIQNVELAVAGNNPMVGMTVAIAVAFSQVLAKQGIVE